MTTENNTTTAAANQNVAPETKGWSFGKIATAAIIGTGVVAIGAAAYFLGKRGSAGAVTDTISEVTDVVLKMVESAPTPDAVTAAEAAETVVTEAASIFKR